MLEEVISYELFANGTSIGTSSYSVEDIPMTGRAPFYPGAEIPLDSYLKILPVWCLQKICSVVSKGIPLCH